MIKTEPTESRPSRGRRLWNAFVAGFGWLLSPLSWWNDLLVNVPLAYLFSVPFSLLDERLYVPAFALGYWLTNVVGFVLLHKGVVGMMSRREASLRRDLLVASMYTLVVAMAAALGWLPSPASLLEKTQQGHHACFASESFLRCTAYWPSMLHAEPDARPHP